MKKLVMLVTVLGLVLAVSTAAQATMVTLVFDPNDLIDLYPSSAGASDTYGQNKATQPNARRIHETWGNPYYETFYNPANPHPQPSDYNTYMNWRDGLGEGEGIACFNSWFLDHPAVVTWGETVVVKPGSSFSATAADGWNVRYIVNPYGLGGTSAQWWTTDSSKRIRPGGADIGQFSITADLYVDANGGGWDASDPGVQGGDDIRFWLGCLNGDDADFYRDDTQAIYFDDQGWGTSSPTASGPFGADYGTGAEDYGSGFESVLSAEAIVPEAASIAIWSLLGLSWLGLGVWRRRRMAGGGGLSARPSWSEENRQAIHRIIDRG